MPVAGSFDTKWGRLKEKPYIYMRLAFEERALFDLEWLCLGFRLTRRLHIEGVSSQEETKEWQVFG